MSNRRHFVRTVSATAAGLLLAPPAALSSNVARTAVPPHRALRILVLGGTSFIGPHMVRYARQRGHHITLFNRGRTNPDLFRDVETLIGDRAGQLDALRGHRWDAVIDNSAQEPEWVRLSATLLRDSIQQYVLISTRSVYSDLSAVPMTAAAPVFTMQTASVREGQPLPYGLRKALCEREAQTAMPGRVTVIRPGLIIGPGDETDRFTYWPVRIDRGGEVLAPGDGSDPVQIIDARDLAEWTVRMVEDGHTGVFNAVGPQVWRGFDELLYGIRAVTATETRFTWVDTDFLLERRVRPYSDIPVWQPARDRMRGFARFDITPEVSRGLTFRPLALTARDTLDYFYGLPVRRELKVGLRAEREVELLREWHARSP